MNRLVQAEKIAYDWACVRITTKEAKALLYAYGFEVDFRQRDCGAYIVAYDTYKKEDVIINI